MSDREIVERQLGRPPRAFVRVVRRCPYGRPAVTEQAPFDDEGVPFPTTFYVTCRHLVAAISRLEAAGGVERWTRAAAEDATLGASLRDAHDEQRRLRPELPGGIGGATREGSLKCLHAHAAFALARPGYELGERILAEVDPLWPSERCCSAYPAAMTTVAVELARRQWEEGRKRFEEEAKADPRLLRALEAVTDELRRRVGQSYTLADLAAAYDAAEHWVRTAVADTAAFPGWPRSLTTVQDAAFHLYARGAADYRP